MAEDNMNELISNWSSMSMEDLGTSLLSRKSAIDKASRKKAKRDERIGMAMGVLMAGQSIFANAATKRLKEQERSGKWSKARSLTQLPELNQAGSIYAIMDDLEEHIGINPDGTPFKLNNNNILQILDDNPDFEQRMTSVLHQPIYDYFINHGGKTVADDHNVFEPIKAEILGPVAQNLLTSRDSFKTGAYDIFPELEGQDIKTLWERLSGMELNELDEIKIRQLEDRMQDMRGAGTNVFSLGQWKNLFHKIGLAKEQAKVIDPETGEETELVNIWKHLKDQPLPVEQALKELNLTQNITESIQTIYATTSSRGFEAHAKRFVSDAKTGEIISGMLETEKLQNLQHSEQIETGIRGRRRGLRLLRKSPLRMLAQEINNPLNSDIKNKLELKTAELYLRLKDPGEIAFNRAFFDGTEVTDETKLLNAALSYTLGVTVKDMRTFSGGFLGGKFGTERPLTRSRERGREWRPFKDIRNFEYDFDTIERTVKRPFKVEDGQFKAEQYFYGLKPISQLDAVKDEFNFILSKTNLSDAQKQILTERLVVDTQAANSANLAYDFDPKMTNAKLIDSFNLGLSVEDILTKYETRFRQPEWYQVGEQRRIREADKRIGMAEGGLFGGFFKKRRTRRKDRLERGLGNERAGAGLLRAAFAKALQTDAGKKRLQNLLPEYSDTQSIWAIRDMLGDTIDRTAKDLKTKDLDILKQEAVREITRGKLQGGPSNSRDFKNIRVNTDHKDYTSHLTLASTLGGAQIERDDKGIYWIKDRYNFNRLSGPDEGKLKSAIIAGGSLFDNSQAALAFGLPEGYNKIRAGMGVLGSSEGEGSYVNIRLGNAEELGIRPNKDLRWAELYGDQKWQSDKPTGAGFFSGLAPQTIQKDIDKAEIIYSSQKPINITQAQPSLLKKDDDKVLGRSLFGMPYIKTPPAGK